jgi:SNF2 family DNA or RNA helicase
MEYRPHAYQEYATNKIIEQPAAGLFLEMGLGKTVITLTAVDQLMHDYFDISRVLVIAPLRVAEDTWIREASKWDHLKHLRISRVLGPAADRIQALKQSADIYVINRENVPWLVDFYEKQEWPFDMIIIDELSSFKSPSAKRFKKLRKVRPYAKRVVGLTGTPAPNGLIDLWSQVYILDKGERLGKTMGAYKDEYFKPGRMDRSRHIVYEWTPRAGAEDEIYSRLSDICVSMSAKDWLDLPERIDRMVPVVLSREHQERYEQLERDLILEISGEEVVTAGSAAAVTGKLQQFAQGAIYTEGQGWAEIHDAKLQAMDDLIEEANGKPVLVFYWYKHDLERLQKRYPKARTLDSAKDIEAWNKGKIEILLAHPASAGHGLNLQAGGSTIIWFGLTWSLELYQQANARLHRQGQERGVIVHHLVAEGTVDEDIMAALSGKADGQNALMEAVKARIRRWAYG